MFFSLYFVVLACLITGDFMFKTKALSRMLRCIKQHGKLVCDKAVALLR